MLQLPGLLYGGCLLAGLCPPEITARILYCQGIGIGNSFSAIMSDPALRFTFFLASPLAYYQPGQPGRTV